MLLKRIIISIVFYIIFSTFFSPLTSSFIENHDFNYQNKPYGVNIENKINLESFNTKIFDVLAMVECIDRNGLEKLITEFPEIKFEDCCKEKILLDSVQKEFGMENNKNLIEKILKTEKECVQKKGNSFAKNDINNFRMKYFARVLAYRKPIQIKNFNKGR